ncbi:hypothetical protein [Streptomyces albiaxialis]|uniref:hypothetical protein n=1 Tax=Streptomyces albiaxialis TaxID=329523 RepID=UPI0031D9B529
MNLVLTIFALALALSLTVLVVTWCTVLAALREGLADEEEPWGDGTYDDERDRGQGRDRERDCGDDRERGHDRDACLAGAGREAAGRG